MRLNPYALTAFLFFLAACSLVVLEPDLERDRSHPQSKSLKSSFVSMTRPSSTKEGAASPSS